MNKYIIELDENAKEVVVISLEDGDMWTNTMEVDDLELLNSDYINEHFGSLQDNAYQKGFEDGKAQSEDGCEGCQYVSRTSEDNPCVDCSNNFDNHWTAKQTDKIKVGDEVKQVTESGTETGLLCTVTAIDGDHMNGISQDGRAIVCSSQVNRWWKKTGRHFDIKSILEAMKHD